MVFYGETVLLEAGEPIYFIIPPWPPTIYKIMAGTSSVDRNPDFGFRLAGPSISGALDSARKGMAFGIDEIDDGLCRLTDRANDGYESKIERLVERYNSDAAVLACPSVFIDLLWGDAQLDHPRLASCSSSYRAWPKPSETSRGSGAGLSRRCWNG